MKLQKKHWIFGGIALLVLSITAYFGVKWYQLKKAYQTTLSQDDVAKIVADKTANLSPEMEQDDAILKAQQNDNTGTDATSAVLINNIVYTFNPDTYWFENGNDYYDPATDSLTIAQNTTYQDPNSVTYGTVDENGKFTF